jgi:hypothetical protein
MGRVLFQALCMGDRRLRNPICALSSAVHAPRRQLAERMRLATRRPR